MIRKFLIPLSSFSIIFFVSVALVYAQPNVDNTNRPNINNTNQPNINNTNPGGNRFDLENPFAVGDTLFELLDTVVNRIILPIGGMLAVLAFIYSGFLYVMAQGKSAALEKANKALLYTAIGTAILLGSWVLANVIRGTINQLL